MSDFPFDNFEENVKVLVPPEVKIAILKDKEEELLDLLRALDASLEEQGYAIQRPSENRIVVQSGIRIKNKLTFRGKQKAAELFKRLDEDNDGFLTMEDFRAVQSTVNYPLGVVQEPQYLNWESWKLYMDDIGVHTDDLGRVDVVGFIKYREVVEPKQPLLLELERLGMVILPNDLKMWADMKILINEVISQRQAKTEEEKALTGPVDEDEERMQQLLNPDARELTMDEAAYVLSNLGIVYERAELTKAMQFRASLEKVMDHLMADSMKKHYGSSPQKIAKIVDKKGQIKIPKIMTVAVDDVRLVTPEQLTAWVFSRRPEPVRPGGFYRKCLELKYMVYRQLRHFYSFGKRVYDIAGHLRTRQVFKSFKAVRAVDRGNKSFSVFSTFIGRNGNIDDGMAINCHLSKALHIEELLPNLGFSKDSGTVIFVDLLLRSSAESIEVQRAAESLKLLIRMQLEKEFRRFSSFKSVLVFPTESDGAKVIRVGLALKRAASIDYLLESMHIPYSFTDIVQELSIDINTSFLMDHLFHGGSMSLDTLVSAKVEVKIAYAKNLISGLLQRLMEALNSASSLHHTTNIPTNERELFSFNQNRKMRSYFPKIISWSNTAFTFLRGFKATNMKFKFKNLSELLNRFNLTNSWLKQLFPASIASQSGKFVEIFTRWRENAGKDIGALFEKLKAFLQESAEKEEEQRRKILMESKAQFNSLLSGASMGAAAATGGSTGGQAAAAGAAVGADPMKLLVEKLRRVGMTEGSMDEFFETEAEDVHAYQHSIEHGILRHDVQTYTALERIWKVCLGVSACEIISGKARFSANFTAADLFDLIPEPPSILKVREEIEAQKMKRTRREALMRQQSEAAEDKQHLPPDTR